MRERRRPSVLTTAGCNKIGYPTERAARDAAKRQRRHPRMHRLYPYLCPGCPRWHLTSRKDLGC